MHQTLMVYSRSLEAQSRNKTKQIGYKNNKQKELFIDQQINLINIFNQYCKVSYNYNYNYLTVEHYYIIDHIIIILYY